MSEVVHIKSQELCDSCRWSTEHECEMCSNCNKCSRVIRKRKANGQFTGVRDCQCLNIKRGDPCPYYEEEHHD